ncbi:hypothetical protein MMC28_003501 [Mycoblastus sanguinarius]|nr:hypothetical protein [Mycoblastus sanguinarius]
MIEKRVAAEWLKSMDHDVAASDGESTPVEPDSASLSASTSSSTATIDEEPNQHTPEPDEHSSLLPYKPRTREAKRSWLASKFPTTTILFSSPRLNAAVYGGFIHTMLIVSFDAILPLFVIKTFHWKATAGGLVFLAITIPSLLSTFIGMLSDRYGARFTSLFGFALVTPALGLLGLCKDDSIPSQVLLNVFLVLIGLGLNFILTPLAADVFYEAEILAHKNPSLFGVMGAFAQVYSLFNAALGLAAIVGPGLAGTLYDRTSWQITVGVLAGLCAVGSLPVWRYTGSAKRGLDGEGKGRIKGSV